MLPKIIAKKANIIPKIERTFLGLNKFSIEKMRRYKTARKTVITAYESNKFISSFPEVGNIIESIKVMIGSIIPMIESVFKLIFLIFSFIDSFFFGFTSPSKGSAVT
jgi:hypothetical protein